MDKEGKELNPEKTPIIWANVINFSILHLLSTYAVFLLSQMKFYTWIWFFIIAYVGEIGITAGVHRLWAHRSYKAKLPLRIFLAICNSMAHQNCIFEWARDHRCHHKFTDTDGDPHNAKRGFLYSHIGWLCTKKSKAMLEKGKLVNVDDLLNDPVVFYQRKFYRILILLFCYLIPIVVPWYYWNESIYLSFFGNILRYWTMLNFTFLVNSAAHKWGNKPYDKSILAVQNLLVGLLVIGEGFHNYHHVFPQDYSTSEFGMKLNLTTAFIDLMAYFGLAYDRKFADKAMINARKARTGDTTH